MSFLAQQQTPFLIPAKTPWENLLQRIKNIGPRTMEDIQASADLLGQVPPDSVMSQPKVPEPPFYDAAKWLGRNALGLIGIGSSAVSGPVRALVEDPISDQLQLKANMSEGNADLAALAATGLIPFGLGTKASRAPQLRRVKSGASKGQYIGGPRGLDSPQKLGAMLRDYRQLVELGLRGREFYHDSSNFFLAATGGNVPEAIKLARSSAVYSQRMGVDPNLGHAIKAHYEAALGNKITAGGFPTTQRPTVQDIYRGEDPDLGPKRGPYSKNLQVAWEPGLSDRPVNDIWQGRAMGYTDPEGNPWSSGFSPTQHEFMTTVTNDLITPKLNEDKLGGYDDWDNLKTQASSWSGEQLRSGYIHPGEEGYNYATFEPKYRGLLTRETMPGSTTGHLQQLLSNPTARRDYHDEMMDILIDPKTGKDKIARGFHLLTPEDPFLARGFYVNPAGEVEMNPAYHVPFLSGRKKIDRKYGKMTTMDPATRTLVNAAESAYSQLTAQNAYGWNYVMASDKTTLPRVTAASVDMGRPLTDNELTNLYKKMDKVWGYEAMPSPNDRGFNILYFGPPRHAKKDKKGRYIGSKFADDASKITDTFLKEIGETADIKYAQATTGYKENNWLTERYGETFTQSANISGRPSLRAAYDDVVPEIAAKINALEARFAPKHGLTVNKDIQKMREALARGGLKGLEKLIKTGALPTTLVATLLYELRFGASEPEQS
ncbi:MAG: hypothetical protein QF732_09075 [Nitrospinaceae bacterium]|jgi:hypothetical protein|nr:hypothetical protein [Nitrospinaceae bacterium]